MKLIVAINNLGYIGKDNALLWKCKADMQHFKKMTTDCIVVMGRKTFNSLGNKPLKNRINIVVGSEFLPLDVAIHTAELISKNTGKEIWIIGGESIYNHCINMCDELYISHINDNQVGDAKFDYSHYYGKVQYFKFEKDNG